MAFSGDIGALGGIARELEQRTDAMRTLPGRAAEAIRSVAAAQLGAGLSPYGEPWPARRDGGRALAGAAAHVRVEARGDAVVAVLDEVGEHHQARRPLIPTDARGLPPAWQAELDRVVDEAMGGR
jgi:hypothetical protein